ncbi:hypothetical protein [Paraburkholderia bannensis]|uniref:hypothetical protein n=1 Tax=Paraburkholderia bannensis TaxID=765414 RepID=UPI002ABD555D|nr:hypothetical protein [Paraburkholderia bannensis]
MNRVVADNALLLQCDALYSKVTRVAGAFALFAGVGLGWYLIVALRAGAGA